MLYRQARTSSHSLYTPEQQAARRDHRAPSSALLRAAAALPRDSQPQLSSLSQPRLGARRQRWQLQLMALRDGLEELQHVLRLNLPSEGQEGGVSNWRCGD